MMPEIKKDSAGKTKKSFSSYYVKLVFVFILIFLSFQFGFKRGRESQSPLVEERVPLNETSFVNKDPKSKNIDFSLFWEVWNLLEKKHVDAESFDAKELFYGAIEGMLMATGDPYTNFLDPTENQKFEEEIKGTFEGIGAELGMRGGILTVIAPLRGSPSEEAGLRAGDKIIKVNDEATADMTIDEAVKRIRGEKGTEVKLTIFRNDGSDETMEINIMRDTIKVESVNLEIKENNIAYLEVSRFGETTIREFNSAIGRIPRDISGLILDLRNNPGGYLDVSIELADRMLPKDKVIVIEEDSEGKQKKIESSGGDLFSGIRTVVLINEGSASASEILAGALKENRDNVTIVGKQSFGKGSVQELVNLSYNTAVKITVAKWLTPNGNQINNEGISTDIEVELTEDDWENNRDPQLDKALEILNEE